MLSVSGLTVRYPAPGSRRQASAHSTDVPVALDAVDLDVADGEVVALLGPSGCGKTTLLRVVAGIVAPTDGRIVLDEVDLASVPTHRRGIGLMFQEHALFPHRDVAGNVGFGLRMRGDAADTRSRRVDEVLDLVGLGGYGNRPISTLSGGERQRVALARALAPAPRLLMLDEPLGALDRTLRDELVVELAALFAELGLTVLYVTHDQSEALALADRVVIMEAGTIAQQGAPRQVWDQPASPFVARFLGFTNLVDVQVADGRVDTPWGPVALTEPPVPGQPRHGSASLLVRPEAVRIRPVDGHRSEATVRSVVFRGDHVQVRLDLALGGALDAVVPLAAEASIPEVGQVVAIDIDPSQTQLLAR